MMGNFSEYVKRVVSYPERYERQDGDIAIFFDGTARDASWKDEALSFADHYYGPWLDDVVLVDPLASGSRRHGWYGWCAEQVAKCDAYSAFYGVSTLPFVRYSLMDLKGDVTRRNTLRIVITIETGYEQQDEVLHGLMKSPLVNYDEMPFLRYTDPKDDDYYIEKVDAQTHGESIAQLVQNIIEERED